MALDQPWPRGGASSQWKAWVEEFSDYVYHLSQQEMSRLRNNVRNQAVAGEYYNFERLAQSAMVAKTTRNTTTPLQDLEHTRRKLEMKDFQWAVLTDEEDMIRAKISYNGEYTRNAGMAAGRQIDTLIIDAALGDAVAHDGSTVALPAGQKIAAGGDQMTISKLTQAKYMLDKNEVSAMDRCIVISAQELESLLNTTEITSADYNTVRSLRNGEIDYFLGFQFIRTELLNDDLTDRHCFAFQKDAIGLGIGRDVTTRIGQRLDVSYAWQVYCALSMNATRIEDEAVVQIDCALNPA